LIQLRLIGTIPAKLLLQLTTAFRERGLCNRNGTFFYKDHLHKISTPILAIAGDQDLICPPEAVEGFFFFTIAVDALFACFSVSSSEFMKVFFEQKPLS